MADQLKPHEQRVLVELADLTKRLDDLRLFLRTELATRLDAEDLSLMVAQAGAMTSYQQLLALRIQRWTGRFPLNLTGLASTQVRG